MTIIGFPANPSAFDPAAADKPWVKPKTLEDWPWEQDLGKPYGDINGTTSVDDPKPHWPAEIESLHGSPASEILKKASGLIDGERNAQHGDRKECHTLIARMWTAFLGVQITPTEVASMMVLLKIARTKSGSYNGDCYVDAAGYAALAGELADGGC